jgi:hypothetical protein
MALTRELSKTLTSISNILRFNLGGASYNTQLYLEEFEVERVRQIEQFWRYYNGDHLQNNAQKESLPYANLSYAIVEKLTLWMFREEPQFIFREDIHPVMEELKNEIIDNSGGSSFFYEVRQMGGVSGDAILQPGYDPLVNDGRGGISIKIHSSERTFVEYRNVGNKRELSKVMFFWDELDDNGNVQTYTETWDNEVIKITPPPPTGLPQYEFIPGIDTKPIIAEDNEGKEYLVYENPYGELPFIHIRNEIDGQSNYGKSDLHDFWVINKEINEALLQFKDNIDYHGTPQTIVYGASVNDIERGGDTIWSNLPKPSEAKVENLSVSDTHIAILEYVKLLKQFGGSETFPLHLLGSDEMFTSELSYATLKLAFQPILEVRDKKNITYGKGLSEAIAMGLRFTDLIYKLGLESLNAPSPRVKEKIESFEGLTREQKDKMLATRVQPYYKNAIELYDPIPKSINQVLTDLQLSLLNNLESIPGALKKLGEQDTEQKMQEILDSADFIGQLTAMKQLPVAEAQAGLQAQVQEAQSDQEQSKPASQQDKKSDGNPKGGRGNKNEKENSKQIEEKTGQSSERTETQRATKGKGNV